MFAIIFILGLVVVIAAWIYSFYRSDKKSSERFERILQLEAQLTQLRQEHHAIQLENRKRLFDNHGHCGCRFDDGWEVPSGDGQCVCWMF